MFRSRFCLFSHSKLLVRTPLPDKPDTAVINSFFRAKFVSACQSFSHLLLEKLLRFMLFKLRTLSMNQFFNFTDRLSSCFSCY